jgi:hypothetical protein
MQLDKNAPGTNQTPAQKQNRPPWWVGYVVTFIVGFALWIKSIVSSSHEETIAARNDLKEQLKAANDRQDKLVITLQQNNILMANLLVVIREQKNIPINESLYLDSVGIVRTGSRVYDFGAGKGNHAAE